MERTPAQQTNGERKTNDLSCIGETKGKLG
ncbi:hypothetical protein COLO4_08514 [Corchorus olitorius]|uniref:Uncharacterized protein n=1 Tax=Corchorus olitorius TaxID=93759 RepID=A0A1R3KFL1_9ROSI|nr:hypothetical protein COLO4_08514 [Corchorus olitorius]